MSYVYAGYGITFGALALYAARVLARARALRRCLSLAGAPDPVALEAPS